MQIDLSPREIAHLLAALRFWQDTPNIAVVAENALEAYFEDVETLTGAEIDALCAKIVQASLQRPGG